MVSDRREHTMLDSHRDVLVEVALYLGEVYERLGNVQGLLSSGSYMERGQF